MGMNNIPEENMTAISSFLDIMLYLLFTKIKFDKRFGIYRTMSLHLSMFCSQHLLNRIGEIWMVKYLLAPGCLDMPVRARTS